MSNFNDIAKRNPHGAQMVIQSFGYEIISNRDLGRSLNELVANEGEPALKKIMEIHPDKEIILELFGNKEVEKKSGCGCGGNCAGKKDKFLNASGAQNEQPSEKTNILAHQTNAILMVSALFIATALIIKK